jgi:cytochrome o ubiquinol oxidase subunit 2
MSARSGRRSLGLTAAFGSTRQGCGSPGGFAITKNKGAAIAALALLAGCGKAVLQPAGPVSHAERTILLDSFAIMLAIVIPTAIATLAFAWWFRASNTRARHLPTFTYSGRLELLIWSIPALVVIFLGGIAWIGAHDLDPARPLSSRVKPLEIDVVSLDWKWLFIYPEQGIASVNRLIVPAGVPLRFRVTSATVFNVFWVPQLGSELYCMNGMAGTLNLEADHPGIYPGLSAQFSGDGFSDMHFDVHALTTEQFAAWAAATRSAGPALDEAAYGALLRPTERVPPYTYRSVRAGLFDAIVMRKLPAGEGPRRSKPNAAVRPES